MIRKILLMFTAMIMLVACGQSSDNNESNGSNWEAGQGELPSLIGDRAEMSTAVQQILQNGYFIENYEMWEKLGFQTPTGNWFMVNGEGAFGYGLTTGTQKPGAELMVSLFGHKENGERMDKNVRIQLIEIGDSVDEQSVIIDEEVYVDMVPQNEEIIYTGIIPEKEMAIYILAVEVLSEQGEVEDTRISTIYVPTEEVNAELKLDANEFEQGETEASLVLTNYGPTILMLGKAYSFEKFIDGEWKKVPLELAFEDIGIILHVGQEYKQTVDLSPLESGKYRVIKEFFVDGFEQRHTIAAEFTIK